MKKCSYCKELKEYTLEIDKDIFICKDCEETVENQDKMILNVKDNKVRLTPMAIKEELDKYVVKQDDAKIALAIEAYNHIKRCQIEDLADVEKNNILLIGPSGCGKTYLVETLAKIINVPFVTVNATEFTASGYVGKSVTSIGKYLINAAKGNISLAEKGIVFIDEVDKLAGKEGLSKDVGGIEVQKELLKIIEGEDLRTNDEEDEFFGEIDGITINTKNILFIFSGAFEFLTKKEEPVSFLPNKKKVEEKEITPEELIKNGFLKEFVGRIPIITEVQELSIDDISDILTKTENNLISQYQKLFAYDGIELSFTKDAIKEIATLAYRRKIGARGCKSILGKIMQNIIFTVDAKKTPTLVVTKEIVNNSYRKFYKSKNNKI